jgi:hypothetical protein
LQKMNDVLGEWHNELLNDAGMIGRGPVSP